MSASTSKIPWKILIPCATALLMVLGMFLISNLTRTPPNQSVRVSFPGVNLEMDVSDPVIDHEEFMNNIFGDSDSNQLVRDGALAWMRREHQVFSIQDPLLVTALEENLCPEIFPKDPLDEKIRKGAECTGHPVAGDLRELVANRVRPFHYIGEQVRVGVQTEEPFQPALERANACREGVLVGRLVELSDPVSNNVIQVEVSGSYPCTGFTRYPDIQLNPDEAREFFDRPLDEYQDAFAVPLD